MLSRRARWGRAPSRAVDGVLGGAVAVAGAVDVALARTPLAGLLAAAVGAMMVAAVLLCRRQPGLVLLVVAVAVAVVDGVSIAGGGAAWSFLSIVAVLVLAFAWGRWAERRDAVTGLMGLLVLCALGAWTATGGPGEAVAGAAVLLGAALLGAAVRYRASARAHELHAVRLQERELLARELHDTVAHAVTAMAVQAQAGLVLLEDDELPHDDGATRDRVAACLRHVEQQAARCLADMRDLVASLRPVDGPVTTGRLDADTLRALAAGPGAPGGPTVEVEVTGDLTGYGDQQLWALQRVIQESITNARRHARRATRVSVLVAAGPDQLVTVVRDDGESLRLRPHETGHGLVGMGERLRLLGGSVEAGPDPAGGWTVEAHIPRRSR